MLALTSVRVLSGPTKMRTNNNTDLREFFLLRQRGFVVLSPYMVARLREEACKVPHRFLLKNILGDIPGTSKKKQSNGVPGHLWDIFYYYVESVAVRSLPIIKLGTC